MVTTTQCLSVLPMQVKVTAASLTWPSWTHLSHCQLTQMLSTKSELVLQLATLSIVELLLILEFQNSSWLTSTLLDPQEKSRLDQFSLTWNLMKPYSSGILISELTSMIYIWKVKKNLGGKNLWLALLSTLTQSMNEMAFKSSKSELRTTVHPFMTNSKQFVKTHKVALTTSLITKITPVSLSPYMLPS
jgi:hypothetical protein